MGTIPDCINSVLDALFGKDSLSSLHPSGDGDKVAVFQSYDRDTILLSDLAPQFNPVSRFPTLLSGIHQHVRCMYDDGTDADDTEDSAQTRTSTSYCLGRLESYEFTGLVLPSTNDHQWSGSLDWDQQYTLDYVNGCVVYNPGTKLWLRTATKPPNATDFGVPAFGDPTCIGEHDEYMTITTDGDAAYVGPPRNGHPRKGQQPYIYVYGIRQTSLTGTPTGIPSLNASAVGIATCTFENADSTNCPIPILGNGFLPCLSRRVILSTESIRFFDYRALLCISGEDSQQKFLRDAVREYVYRPQADDTVAPWSFATNITAAFKANNIETIVSGLVRTFIPDPANKCKPNSKGTAPIAPKGTILSGSPLCDCICLDSVSGAINYKARMSYVKLQNTYSGQGDAILTPAQTHICASRSDIYGFTCVAQPSQTICNIVMKDKKNNALINDATEANIISCGPGSSGASAGPGGAGWTMADIIMTSLGTVVVLGGLGVWLWRRRRRHTQVPVADSAI